MGMEKQWCGVMQSVDQSMSESYGHHCQETEAWKGEYHCKLWECQWNFQRDFNGSPEEKDHCRQEIVLFMKWFFVKPEDKTAIKFQERKNILYTF